MFGNFDGVEFHFAHAPRLIDVAQNPGAEAGGTAFDDEEVQPLGTGRAARGNHDEVRGVRVGDEHLDAVQHEAIVVARRTEVDVGGVEAVGFLNDRHRAGKHYRSEL